MQGMVMNNGTARDGFVGVSNFEGSETKEFLQAEVLGVGAAVD